MEMKWMKEWMFRMTEWNLPTSSSKSAPNVTFLQFLCETELSPQSRAHLADLILQECSEHVRFYVFI
jgi:hypothetical protein